MYSYNTTQNARACNNLQQSQMGTYSGPSLPVMNTDIWIKNRKYIY